MSKLANLRIFVNAAHDHAVSKHNCALIIIQEMETYVIVGLHTVRSHAYKTDPDCICELHIVEGESKNYCNCKFLIKRDPDGDCIINAPADLFRLMHV